MPEMLIERLNPQWARRCAEQFPRMGYTKPEGYFQRLLLRQDRGEIEVRLAVEQENFLGQVRLVWESDHPPFRSAGIPEIKDLNVLPERRRQGIGSRLLDAVEALASARSGFVGIRVGLSPDYNAAQRLYTRRGFFLDGTGVTHAHRPVQYGESPPFDDSLTLSLRKALR